MKRSILGLACTLTLVVPGFAQQFGSAVAVYGEYVVVGDGNSPAVPGSVYIFGQVADGEWEEVHRISAIDSGGAVDGFGSAIAIHDKTMVVGAPKANKAYVFQLSANGVWVEVAQLTGSGEQFGSAVALDTAVILVGAPSSADALGSVSVFEKTDGDTWNAAGSLEAEGIEFGDGFGSVLAIGGGEALVSAPGAANGAGAVYAFSRNKTSGEWKNHGSIQAPHSADGNGFGSSLLLNENVVRVGAPGYANGIGTVFNFGSDIESGRWIFRDQFSPFSAEPRAGFGSSMTAAGNQLWIGAPGYGGRRGSGTVYEFDLDLEKLSVRASRHMDQPPLPDLSQYGVTLAANEGVAVIGSTGYDYRAGVAFPLARTDNTWFHGDPVVNDIFGYDSIAGELIECEKEVSGDFPCKDVDMMSFVSMKDLGADRGIRTNDLWGWEDLETGREYAIVGLSNQTSFVDVSDPYNPIFLGELDMPETANMSPWRDMKVYKDHAYIVSDGAGEHGIQIFDLRQLRNVQDPPVVFEETAHYAGIFSAHNIVINEDTGFAYSVGSSAGGETCGGGLHMIDLSDPPNPTFAGCFSDGVSGRRGTGYSHDAQCVIYHGPDTAYQGHEICISANETAISIADVTDKDNPVGIAMADYPGVAYAHQGWLTDDHRYFYLNDELDEARDLVDGTRTLIWDFTDLDEPELAGEFVAETTETDHNLYVKGNLMYQSNTAAGLRILDISNPEEPFETAYFDTSPVGGRGVSWSNYPFFKSGIIVVTGGHYGLFILRKKDVDI